MDRAAWIVELRRVNEREEDALAPTYDEHWGEIDQTHRAFVERFLSMVPPAGRDLDAACGTGKYLADTERHDLQDLAYREAFDGVMCVDAMEMIPPEDWPVVLRARARRLKEMRVPAPSPS